jgi:hypothetical protein
MTDPHGNPNLLTAPADEKWKAIRKGVAVSFAFQNIKKKYPLVVARVNEVGGAPRCGGLADQRQNGCTHNGALTAPSKRAALGSPGARPPRLRGPAHPAHPALRAPALLPLASSSPAARRSARRRPSTSTRRRCA